MLFRKFQEFYSIILVNLKCNEKISFVVKEILVKVFSQVILHSIHTFWQSIHLRQEVETLFFFNSLQATYKRKPYVTDL